MLQWLNTRIVQPEALQVYMSLCRDETPMVRKNAFLKLKDMAALLPKDKVKAEIFPLVKALCSEEIDSMRIHGVECCLGLAGVMDPPDAVTLVLPLVEVFHDDNSWKVRQSFARQSEAVRLLCFCGVGWLLLLKSYLFLLLGHSFAKSLGPKLRPIESCPCLRGF